MRYRIVPLLFAVLALAGCGNQPGETPVTTTLPVTTTYAVTTTEPTTAEPTTRREHTKEDFIAVLEALKEAFATGEYRAFAERYTEPTVVSHIDWDTEPNDWASLLAGVVAEMSYRPQELNISDLSECWLQASLKVRNGNSYLPSGNQTVNLRLTENSDGAPVLYSIMLITDGRITNAYNPPFSSMEDKLRYLTDCMYICARTPLPRTMFFLGIFEDFSEGYTKDEIIAGAKKYLGLNDYVPSEDEISEIVKFRNGKYVWGGTGFADFDVYFSVLILKKPSQGDITCRAFTYADSFLLKISETTEYNFRILEEPGGAPYAKLLSVQTEELA